MPDYDDHFSWKDLTRTEQEAATARLVDSFGAIMAQAMIDKNRDVLAKVNEMCAHREEGDLSPLNPDAFDFPTDIVLPESHLEISKREALKAQPIKPKSDSFLTDAQLRRSYADTASRSM